MSELSPFEAIANCTYDWETWVSASGETRWVNPAVERMTGHSPEACLKMPDYPAALVDPEHHAKLNTALESARRGDSGNDLELRLKPLDGVERWGAMSWRPLRLTDGTELGYRTSIRDITERKRMEARLRAALSRAEASERARAQLLANVSHELRTPIHNLLGYAELLESCPPPRPEAREWLGVIRREGETLLGLVDDLLQLSARDAQPEIVRRAWFDPRALLARTAEAHRAQIESRGCALQVDLGALPDRLWGDARALEQIVRNLLDNARKFTDAGHVRLAAGVVDPGEVWIEVSDTGRGMDQGAFADLRRPFARADASKSRGTEGAGLGLAIIDRLLEGMGGRCRVRSALGKGTCFRVEIPAEAGSASGPRVSTELPDSVLVIDDNAASRALALAHLRSLGCEAEAVGSAEEGLERCRARSFSVVVTDLHMPGLDGLDATHLIRATHAHEAPPPRVVALTADAFEGAGETFDGYLLKPVRRDGLEACLRGLETRPAPDDLAADGPLVDIGKLEEFAATTTEAGVSFLEQFGCPALAELRAARVGCGSVRADAERAHQWKGAAALLGARRLEASAARLQAACENGAGIELAHAGFARDLDATLRALDRLVPSMLDRRC